MAPLTNAPFAVVEDTNGNDTDGATPVPEKKKEKKTKRVKCNVK